MKTKTTKTTKTTKLLLAFLTAFITICCATLSASRAQAEPLTDAAPWAGKCFGAGTSTCLVPALSFDVSTIALNGQNAGKLSVGATPLGLGYNLLFGYDTWWATGPAIHAILDLSQAQASFLQVAVMLTTFRYIHVGVVCSVLGGERAWYAATGLTLPFDVVTTTVADSRAKTVRSVRAGAE